MPKSRSAQESRVGLEEYAEDEGEEDGRVFAGVNLFLHLPLLLLSFKRAVVAVWWACRPD